MFTVIDEIILDMIIRCPYSVVRIIESHLNKRFSVDNDPIIRGNFFRRIMERYRMHRIEHYVSHFDILVALNQTDAEDWSKFVKTKVICNMRKKLFLLDDILCKRVFQIYLRFGN